MRLAALLSFASLAGCAPALASCNVLGEVYSVHVSPNFPQAYREAIDGALASWQALLPGDIEISDLTVDDCDAQPLPELGPERRICLRAVEDLGAIVTGRTYRYPLTDSSDIYISMSLTERMPDGGPQTDIAHELGHAFGLEHTQEGTVMYWEYSGQSSAPTCDDAAQFLAIRHMSVATTACPDGGSFTYFH